MSAIYIGVMTGTSMDGLDLVAASFDPLKIHATLTLKFEEDLRDQLMALSLPDDNEIDRMAVAHVSLGKMIGNGVNQLIEDNQLDRSQIKLVMRTSLPNSPIFLWFTIFAVVIWQQMVKVRHWFLRFIKCYFSTTVSIG